MNIVEFFTQLSSIYRYEHPVICFTGKTYQPIFLQKMYSFIGRHIGQTLHKLSVDQDLSEIQVTLATTFLGQRHWYYFDNIGALSPKKREAYIRFITEYKGPHRLIAFIETDHIPSLPKELISCVIQDIYTYDMVKHIKLFYEHQNSEVAAYFFSKLYRYKKEYSLEQLCMLQEYAALLGKNMTVFFEQWFEKLVVSDVSLFYMSQLFFEKNVTEFFLKWQQIRGNYSDQFWTSFFSEQLFKAYFYVHYQGAIPTDQKPLLFGLPFSFLKHDWKVYQLRELKHAHQKIYEIDVSLKQGGGAFQLDAFLMSFFTGTFE